MNYTLSILKAIAENNDELELGQLINLSNSTARQVIATLANNGKATDELWCMYILEHLRPNIYNFLNRWTAGGFEEIRQIQERGSGSIAIELLISEFMKDISLLPKTKRSFVHYSEDNTWHLRLEKRQPFKLRSFMSCAISGSHFSYSASPRLRFTSSSQVRYVGALTRECGEREVLIPPGSKFIVEDIRDRIVYLSDFQ